MTYHFRRLLEAFICLGTIVAALSARADSLRVSTCNTYFLFRPEYSGGQLRDKGPPDDPSYERKVQNLASLVIGSEVVALQEIGSMVEVSDFAKALAGTPVFAHGRDSYTGENVGFVHYLRRGYVAVHHGRVGMLDREISKHLLLVIDGPTRRFNILNVHLIVASRNPTKNEAQRLAIGRWLEAGFRQEPHSIFLIVGDLNISHRGPVLPYGHDALETMRWPHTHSSRLTLDRLIVIGSSHWKDSTIVAPPYGRRPNDLNKLLWTDHFVVTSTLVAE